jgi:hypothetical protein
MSDKRRWYLYVQDPGEFGRWQLRGEGSLREMRERQAKENGNGNQVRVRSARMEP